MKIDEYDFKKAYEYFKMFQSLDFSNPFSNPMLGAALPISLMRTFLMEILGIYFKISERSDYDYFERQIL